MVLVLVNMDVEPLLNCDQGLGELVLGLTRGVWSSENGSLLFVSTGQSESSEPRYAIGERNSYRNRVGGGTYERSSVVYQFCVA